MNSSMLSVPRDIIPILKNIRTNSELEFWLSDDPDLIDDYVALAYGLDLSDLNLNDLPKGYSMIAKIFVWESSSQMSGWYAFSNLEYDIENIISAYRTVGLNAEADCLTAAFTAWYDSNENDKITSQVYSQIQNPYSDETKRWNYLFSYFKENSSQLVYEEVN